MDQSETILLALAIVGVGVLSLLAGVFEWSWWMNTIGFFARKQFGDQMARWHFIIVGLVAIGMGAYFAYDALTAPRFQPLPAHPPEQNAPAEPRADH